MDAVLRPKNGVFILFLGTVLALAVAFILEIVFDLQPCVVCVYQRWPYLVASTLTCAMLLFPAIFNKATLVLTGMTIAAATLLAAYHIGIEQGWWAAIQECGGHAQTATTVAELKAQLLASPVPSCSNSAFKLIGFSIAEYNFVYSASLFVFTAVILKEWQKRA